MVVTIESDIPPPEDYMFQGRGGRRSIYPFMQMNVGDSVFFDDATASHAYDYAKKIAKRAGDRRFTSKRMGDGIRIWRIA